MLIDKSIKDLIPHRPPFLWVDEIIERSDDSIVAEKLIPEDLDVFKGHYPEHPLMPGVLICEAIFQTGALLLSNLLHNKPAELGQKIPVLTKITGARFKRQVRPGDTVRMSVKLVETVSSVCLLKGTASVNGKVAVKTEFSCALVSA
ncbi:MAG: beta-hydroxyacyl-ACP dehydratase [Desulfobulbaceae bacterium]|nr:MAG: beta-hydroxyacyl-ACP dehydratase [Desulfobulbaceae bacterium]